MANETAERGQQGSEARIFGVEGILDALRDRFAGLSRDYQLVKGVAQQACASQSEAESQVESLKTERDELVARLNTLDQIIGGRADAPIEDNAKRLVESKRMCRDCEPIVGSLDLEELEALKRFLKGEAPGFSTGIHEGLTAGYGICDGNGYWQYPLPQAFVDHAERSVVTRSLRQQLTLALKERDEARDMYVKVERKWASARGTLEKILGWLQGDLFIQTSLARQQARTEVCMPYVEERVRLAVCGYQARVNEVSLVLQDIR